MLISETNNPGYTGASHAVVEASSHDDAERILRLKFPGRPEIGETAEERVANLRTILDATCAFSFQIIAE